MFKNFFLPTKSNNYTPHLLKRSAITVYTLVLLVFNLVTSNVSSLQAAADVDTQSLVTLHNEAREKAGLRPLTINSKLVRSAQMKADAMLASDCWDHYCPNGKSPWDFFDAVGYDYVYAGENLAEGFNDNDKVFNAWMNSKTHRENIMRPEFTEIGIAIAYGKFQGIENNAVIVVHFGSTEETSSLPNTSTNSPDETSSSFAITSPQQDSLINTNTPKITGKSPDGNVQISENAQKIGSSIANEGLFTYQVPKSKALVEGKHTIKASNKTTKQNDSVDFEVDTIAPKLSDLTLDSVTSNKTDIANVQIQASEDTAAIETQNLDYKFTKLGSTTWQMQIPVKELNKHDTLTLTAFDNANNKTSTTYPLGAIKGEAAESLRQNKPTHAVYNFIQKVGTRRIVNSAFIFLIILLILIDYYALVHTELPIGVIRTKAQYHLSVFAI